MDNPAQASAAVEVLKASPPVSVVGMSLWGVPLSDILIVLTVIYTVAQIYFLFRDKVWRDKWRKDGRE